MMLNDVAMKLRNVATMKRENYNKYFYMLFI